jgi:crossover junction endodeoxyribonuclease RuvC
MTKYVCGVDPGTFGAICLYNPELPLILFDMPILKISRNGKERNQIDLYALARWVDEHSKDIKHAYIENPQGMPAMASNSTYRLGLNCGIAQMAIAANLIPMTLIAPATWKKAMGLGKSKDDSRLKASQLCPVQSSLFSRAKDDGRAESLLLAIYGLKMAGNPG